MYRNALFVLIALSLTACASDSSSKKDTAAESIQTAAAKTVEAAPASPAAAPAVAKNTDFADIPFAPFDPKKPDGIHVYAFMGTPKGGPFSAIVRMPAGYETPLHTHKASYSGVSLSEGIAHGASSEGAKVLPKGSTWHQPGAEAHVDACKSKEPCHMLVFFDGAIDMTPVKEAAAEPKMQINPADQIKWAELKGGVKMAVIHGKPKEGAFVAMFDFPAGMSTNVHTHSAGFSGGLLSGSHQRGPSADKLVTLSAGSVWYEPADSPHMEKCGAESNCILVASMDGPLDTKAVKLTPAAK